MLAIACFIFLLSWKWAQTKEIVIFQRTRQDNNILFARFIFNRDRFCIFIKMFYAQVQFSLLLYQCIASLPMNVFWVVLSVRERYPSLNGIYVSTKQRLMCCKGHRIWFVCRRVSLVRIFLVVHPLEFEFSCDPSSNFSLISHFLFAALPLLESIDPSMISKHANLSFGSIKGLQNTKDTNLGKTNRYASDWHMMALTQIWYVHSCLLPPGDYLLHYYHYWCHIIQHNLIGHLFPLLLRWNPPLLLHYHLHQHHSCLCTFSSEWTLWHHLQSWQIQLVRFFNPTFEQRTIVTFYEK